uniref:Uncharacterized protein n=1 Tax=Glossina austeni TaxID=7395 RepID=A0A1A9VDT6_GLOAU
MSRIDNICLSEILVNSLNDGIELFGFNINSNYLRQVRYNEQIVFLDSRVLQKYCKSIKEVNDVKESSSLLEELHLVVWQTVQVSTSSSEIVMSICALTATQSSSYNFRCNDGGRGGGDGRSGCCCLDCGGCCGICGTFYVLRAAEYDFSAIKILTIIKQHLQGNNVNNLYASSPWGFTVTKTIITRRINNYVELFIRNTEVDQNSSVNESKGSLK